MHKLILSLAAFSLMVSSCDNSTKDKSTNQTEVAEHNKHLHEDGSEAINLNKGEKWKVDANMLVHIRNMENEIVSFTKVEQKDYKLLSEKLQVNIDLLTSNCTMKGEAHDELHKWLLPYTDLVKELSEAKFETEALKFKYIQISFKTFNQYFQ
ncbi:MAG: hypothetical protein WC044_08825 [Crocinitomicaceae bacterium]